MKKILALVLAMMMVLTMGAVAFASEAEEPAAPTKGTITVKNATKGYTYEAYKVFDATYSGTAVSYTTPAANATKLDANLFGWSTAADANGNISVWVKEGVADTDVTDWIEAHYADFGGTKIDGVFDDANSTVTFSNLDFGYYYIKSGLGATVTIDTAAPSAEVYDKNETESVDPTKVITGVDGKALSDVKDADAHVGSVVDFKVTAATTNWIDKDTIRTEWVFTDKPTNMTINQSTVVVKFNGTALTKDTDYTLAVADDGQMTITVPMIDDKNNSKYVSNLGEEAGQIPIEITYSTTIDATAGAAPAKNEIPGDNPPPPNIVSTYAFQVAKTDDKNVALPGAQFELWSDKGVEGGTAAALTFIDNGDGTYTYSADGTVTTLDMTTNTTIVVKGLDNAWTYTLKEITVPEGYNQAEDVTIAGKDLTKVTETTTTADGTTTTTVVDTSVTSTELYKETVVNKAGATLPSTGGIGTTIFYIAGSILVLAAAILLVTKRRMGADD